MTNCKVVHENLFAYAENELPPAMMQLLDKHVSECPACNNIVAQFRSTLVLMEEQKFIEPRPFAETRIMQRIESRSEVRQKSATSLFVKMLQPAIISAGVAAALAIGFFIGSDVAGSHSQFTQNDEVIEAVRSDLNVPEFMTDDLFHFTE